MKKLMILFSILLLIFMGMWVFKAKTPVDIKTTISQNDVNEGWWENQENLPSADTEWILDPEIPMNYIPVPGEDELYMVVDENGKITAYRHRTLQDDGSWLWTTVNPDIPDNYEAVDGLENIYKVTNPDGSVSYFKYIRNDDDTFAFVPVDENGKILEDLPSGSEIPENYHRITENIYAVYNENNVIIGYKERIIDENGNYMWIDCEKPSSPEDPNQKPSDENIDESEVSDKENSTHVPSLDISDNISQDNNSDVNTDVSANTPSESDTSDASEPASQEQTYTETETIETVEVKGGWRVTYRTTITRVYDSDGLLISTKKDGPHEVSKEKVTDSDGYAPDKSKIKETLKEEYARVSVGISYKDDLAKEVLTEINAERAALGLGSLALSSDSDISYLSKIRAADMAIYNHSDYDSPMYGTAAVMCDTFNLSFNPSEMLWKTAGDKTATAIASRLKIMSNDALMNNAYTSIGISIVSKNGYYYIDLLLS